MSLILVVVCLLVVAVIAAALYCLLVIASVVADHKESIDSLRKEFDEDRWHAEGNAVELANRIAELHRRHKRDEFNWN